MQEIVSSLGKAWSRDGNTGSNGKVNHIPVLLANLLEEAALFKVYRIEVFRLFSETPVEERPAAVRGAMEALLAEGSQRWAGCLLDDRPSQVCLFADGDAGFAQMAHVQPTGHAIPPHDHGGTWVVYGVVEGCLDISTYEVRHLHSAGVCLKTLTSEQLKPGAVRVYLESAVHSTRSVATSDSVILRFLSRDLTNVARMRYRWDDVVT